MFTLKVSSHFDSAHHLPGYDGPCSNRHGHRWLVEACFQFTTYNSLGMCVDFKELKAALDRITDVYDHDTLNTYFNQPTAEILAHEIYGLLHTQINALVSVTIFETPDTSVTYEETKNAGT
jgi:6-pyruvoyltetrahydropterin/6-carboxytetrahydropterin synthase